MIRLKQLLKEGLVLGTINGNITINGSEYKAYVKKGLWISVTIENPVKKPEGVHMTAKAFGQTVNGVLPKDTVVKILGDIRRKRFPSFFSITSEKGDTYNLKLDRV